MMKIQILIIALLGALCITACSKDDREAPVVDTIDQFEATTSNKLILTGNVLNPGSGAVVARGVVYSSSENPVKGNTNVFDAPAEIDGTDKFSVFISMSSLQMNTVYYFRAYAQNVHGLTYGKQVVYQTPTYFPTMATFDPVKLTNTSYTIGGELILTGGEAVVAHGFLYTTRTGEFDINTSDATLINLGAISEPATFTKNIEDLEQGTKYYVKSYATNVKGTGYGEVKSFITPSKQPAVEITNSEMLAADKQLIEMIVHSEGASALIEVGIVYGTTEKPSVGMAGSTAIALGNEVKAYTTVIENLASNTKYYVRAYAQNSDGSSYSAERTFTSGLSTPVITSKAPSMKTPNSFFAGGTVTAGDEGIVQRGVVYSTVNAEPTITGSNDVIVLFTGSSNDFSVELNNLASGMYYVRAFATNSKGAGYGEVKTFSVAHLQTIDPIKNSESVLVSGGELTLASSLSLIECGVLISTDPNPIINDGKSSSVLSSTVANNFQVNINLSTLQTGTKYYIRAFVNTSSGYVYGTQTEYTVALSNPTVTTLPVIINNNTYTLQGKIDGGAGAAITVHGFVFSKKVNPETDPDAIIRNSTHNGETQFEQLIDIPLTAGKYYVLAFVKNSTKTIYGNQVEFTVN